jgi:hypothetical protein
MCAGCGQTGGRSCLHRRQRTAMCRYFYGSDGTRTRDLRRDRPRRAHRRSASSSFKQAHLQGLFASIARPLRMLEPIVSSTFGPQVGHGVLSSWTTPRPSTNIVGGKPDQPTGSSPHGQPDEGGCHCLVIAFTWCPGRAPELRRKSRSASALPARGRTSSSSTAAGSSSSRPQMRSPEHYDSGWDEVLARYVATTAARERG